MLFLTSSQVIITSSFVDHAFEKFRCHQQGISEEHVKVPHARKHKLCISIMPRSHQQT